MDLWYYLINVIASENFHELYRSLTNFRKISAITSSFWKPFKTFNLLQAFRRVPELPLILNSMKIILEAALTISLFSRNLEETFRQTLSFSDFVKAWESFQNLFESWKFRQELSLNLRNVALFNSFALQYNSRNLITIRNIS